MEYLNLEASVFRSPEFIGADPAQRGTWIALQGWCASQENSGRIVNCRGWKDRMWQQLLGVTSEEVLAESTLWEWNGDDLMVIHYPIEQELALRAKRDGNARGGKASSEAKTSAARSNGSLGGRPRKVVPDENPSKTQVETQDEPNVKEGKGKEGNVREGESAGARSEPAALSPSLLNSVDRVLIHLGTVFPTETKSLDFDDREALAANIAVFEEMTEADWLAAKCWIICPQRIRDRTPWPRDRSEFIHNPGKALAQIRPWWKRAGEKWWNGQQGRRDPPTAQPAGPSEPAEEAPDSLRIWKELNKDVA